MGNAQISKEEMVRHRLARFKELKKNAYKFLDMIIPGHERSCYAVIGPMMGEDPNVNPAISAYEDGLSVGYTLFGPGKGTGLHYHPKIEVFVCLTGKFVVFWGDEAENEVTMEKWDVISIPAGVMRSFRNMGTEDAMLMGLHPGGRESMHITWSPKMIKEAEERGWVLDEHGNLVMKTPQVVTNPIST